MVVYRYNVSYALADGKPCTKPRPWEDTCFLEIPQVAYVAVWARPVDDKTTNLGVRLTPMPSVASVRWASKDLTLYDLDAKSTRTYSSLSTSDVIDARGECKRIGNYRCVGAAYTEANVAVKPSVANVELRFPAIIAGDKVVETPPIRYHDGGLIAIPSPLLYQAH